MATNHPNPIKLQQSLKSIDEAIQAVRHKSPRILIKIARNLGDSLHGQPIIRHYRNLHPGAGIIFACEQRYHGAHEYDKNIDKIVLLPNDLGNPDRLALWDPIKKNKNLDLAIIPAINPFQYVHTENNWNRKANPNIVDQYLRNAGITGEPLGGRPITVGIDDNDRKWAADFLISKRIPTDRLIGIEYNSYSAPRVWNAAKYAEFISIVRAKGWVCLSFAGAREALLPGTIDARGASWRQTVALLSKVKYMLGCSSGNTMLALASRPQPALIELDPPGDCRADGTGYIIPGNTCVGAAYSPKQAAEFIK